MNEKEKKALLNLIDELAEVKGKINTLQEKRSKANAEWDAEMNTLWLQQDTIYEKKRILEREVVDSMVLSSPTSVG